MSLFREKINACCLGIKEILKETHLFSASLWIPKLIFNLTIVTIFYLTILLLAGVGAYHAFEDRNNPSIQFAYITIIQCLSLPLAWTGFVKNLAHCLLLYLITNAIYLILIVRFLIQVYLRDEMKDLFWSTCPTAQLIVYETSFAAFSLQVLIFFKWKKLREIIRQTQALNESPPPSPGEVPEGFTQKAPKSSPV